MNRGNKSKKKSCNMLYQSLGEVRRNIQAMEKKNPTKLRKVLWLMLYMTYIKFNIFLNYSCPPRIKTKRKSQKTPKNQKKSPRTPKSWDCSSKMKTTSNSSRREPMTQILPQRLKRSNGEKTGTMKISTKISQNS